MAEDDKMLLCTLDGQCNVSFETFSDQDSDPFMVLGKVIGPSAPRWQEFRRTIRRYRSAADCVGMVSDEGGKLGYAFDWSAHRASAVRDVCVFRIARSLGTPEAIREWLRGDGFRVSPLSRVRSAKYEPRFEDDPISKVQANWSLEQYRRHFPSLLSSVFGLDQINSFSVHIQFSEAGRVVGARTRANTK